MTDNGTVLSMKQQVDEMVYSSVVIEAIPSTFEQTREIIETGTAAGVDRESIGKILNIKRAWKYLLTKYRDEPSWDAYSDYNRIIGEGCVEDAGTLRAPGSVMVGTGGQDPYIPPPVSGEDDFNRILGTAKGSFADIDDAAAALFLMLCRAQFFHDGNKRSAQLLVNHFLAHADAGYILCVPQEKRDDLLNILVDYYTGALSLDDAELDTYNLVIRKAVMAPIAKEPMRTGEGQDVSRGHTRGR